MLSVLYINRIMGRKTTLFVFFLLKNNWWRSWILLRNHQVKVPTFQWNFVAAEVRSSSNIYRGIHWLIIVWINAIVAVSWQTGDMICLAGDLLQKWNIHCNFNRLSYQILFIHSCIPQLIKTSRNKHFGFNVELRNFWTLNEWQFPHNISPCYLLSYLFLVPPLSFL